MQNYNSKMPTYDLNLFNEDKKSDVVYMSRWNEGSIKDLYDQSPNNT
jgi:hypothetical protein